MTRVLIATASVAILAIAADTASARVVFVPSSPPTRNSLPYTLECFQREGTNVFDCQRYVEPRNVPVPEWSPTGWRCFDMFKADHTGRPLLFCKSGITGESKTVYKDFLP